MAGKRYQGKGIRYQIKKKGIARESYLMSGKRYQGKGIRYQIKKKDNTRKLFDGR